MNKIQSLKWALSFVLSLAFAVASCDRASPPESGKPEAEPNTPPAVDPVQPAPARTPPAESVASLDEAAREALGAATLVPSDASYFSATHDLRRRWDAFVQSEAVSRLLRLPGAMMLRQQVLQSPQYREMQQQLQVQPLLAKALDVILDAVSKEIFIYGDARVSATIDAFLDVYSAALLPDPSSGRAGPSLRYALEAALERKDDLRFPGFAIGFALQKPDEARQFLAEALAALAAAGPGPPIIEQAIGDGNYHTLFLGARMFLPPGVSRSLMREGVPEPLARDFEAFIASQILAVSVGLHGDYLILSLGADNVHLGRLGQGTSLAESPALAPVRDRLKGNLLSLLYVAEELTLGGKIDRDSTLAFVDSALENARTPPFDAKMKRRIGEDLGKLIDDMNSQTPDRSAVVSMSIENRGIESLTFTRKGTSRLDTSRPLTILSQLGAAPLAVLASRSIPSREGYEKFVRWIGVGKDYFDELVVPEMGPQERVEFQRFQEIFVPALKELDATTREFLFPAADGTQSALVIDESGDIRDIPASPVHLQQPIRIPRPAVVLKLKDAQKFREAFARYRGTINRAILKMSRTSIGLEPFQIPEPVSRSLAGGTLYTYELPVELGNGIEPHVLIKDDLAILSLFPEQSASLPQAAANPDGELVDLAAASGMAYRIDMERLAKLLVQDAGVVLRAAAADGAVPPEVAGMISIHLPVIGEVIGTLRSFSGRVYTEGDHEVHHSWLKIEDLESGAEAPANPRER